MDKNSEAKILKDLEDRHGASLVAGMPQDDEALNEVVQARRGATLVEVLMYLGIAAFIIGGAILLYNMAYLSYRSNETLTEIMSLVASVHNIYDVGNYNDLSSANMAKSGGLPNKWVQNDSVVDPFGGNVYMSSSYTDGQPAFMIQLDPLPRAVCMRLLTTDFGKDLLGRYPDVTSNGKLSVTGAGYACLNSMYMPFAFYFR